MGDKKESLEKQDRRADWWERTRLLNAECQKNKGGSCGVRHFVEKKSLCPRMELKRMNVK